MKRKILTLLLSFTLIFSMSVSAFAGTDTYVNQDNQISYFAVGDSIATGCQNVDFMRNPKNADPQLMKFIRLQKGKKVVDPYAVDFSFIARVAKQIGADKDSSVNGAYLGLRPKDVCNILDLPLRDGDTYDDVWVKYINTALPKGVWDYLMNNQANKQIYADGIANADVITVYLGENDLTAWLSYDFDRMIFNENGKLEINLKNARLINLIIKPALDIPGQARNIKKFNKDMLAFGKAMTQGPQQYINAKLAVIKDVLTIMNETNTNVTDMVKTGRTFMKEMVDENNYYFNTLMKYINENKKDDAIVVVTTVIDPMGIGSMKLLGIDLSPLMKINDLIVGPTVKEFNQNIKKQAVTTTKLGKKVRNYYVVDISDVNINGEADEYGTYMLHPNNAGQQEIADRIVKQIRDVQTKSTYTVKATNKTKAYGLVYVMDSKVKFGAGTTVVFVPNKGYVVSKVTVNGKDLTKEVKDNLYLDLTNIQVNKDVEVTYEKAYKVALKAKKAEKKATFLKSLKVLFGL
ncbi:MAG: hypothetical protein MJ146_04415 [Clostridia bacterium]|nr:hypothetical protein [Clostridia bacterium]